MTTVYFVRHAESDNTDLDSPNRKLTAKGYADRRLVTEFLQDKEIDFVFSSPYRRAIDTLSDFCDSYGFSITTVDAFREHVSLPTRLNDPERYLYYKELWENFDYSKSTTESFAALQHRNVMALNSILQQYRNMNIVIGTHGIAVSTIVGYYNKHYDYDDLWDMIYRLPWVVKMEFNQDMCIGMEYFDICNPYEKPDESQYEVNTYELNYLDAYRFVVIFARYQDRWLYCRAKSRNNYETAGGHIELGETPLQAAKRELYEETGACSFDIQPVFDYSVHTPSEWANGQVFFADIKQLGSIPPFEMSEVKLFDTIPDTMRFPQILPKLYETLELIRG
jgi:2,3-bisphosphoglycerate-dependent phosphoglycerate mutase